MQPEPRDDAELHAHAAALRALLPGHAMGPTWAGTRHYDGHGGGGEDGHIGLRHEMEDADVEMDTHGSRRSGLREVPLARLFAWVSRRFGPGLTFPLSLDVRQFEATISIDSVAVTFGCVGDDEAFSAIGDVGERAVATLARGVRPDEIDLAPSTPSPTTASLPCLRAN